MNLITDDFIYVIDRDGLPQKVSIEEIIKNATNYIDIAHPWINQVPLYNLLFTIAHSALHKKNKINSNEDKINCYSNYTKDILDYIQKDEIIRSFEFYSEDFFYNYDRNKFTLASESTPKSLEKHKEHWRKFSVDKFSYKSHHLFWNNDSAENLSTYDKVHNLLTYAFFDDGHKNMLDAARAILQKETKGPMGPAPCAKGDLFTFIKGKNIYDTIWLNLLPNSFIKTQDSNSKIDTVEIGAPIWEKKPIDRKDKKALINSQSTYLGSRLPLHSFFSYEKNSSDVYYDLVPQITYDNQKYWLYPHKSTYKKETSQYARAGEDTHFLLREFPLLLGVSKSGYKTPIIRHVENLKAYLKDNKDKINITKFKINCGGLVCQIHRNEVIFKIWDINYFEAKINISSKKDDDSRIQKYANKFQKIINIFDSINYKKVEKELKKKKRLHSYFNIEKKNNEKKNPSYLKEDIDKMKEELWDNIDCEYQLISDSANNSVLHKQEWEEKVEQKWFNLINRYFTTESLNKRIMNNTLKDIVSQLIREGK